MIRFARSLRAPGADFYRVSAAMHARRCIVAFLAVAGCLGASPAAQQPPPIAPARIERAVASLTAFAEETQKRSGIPGMAIAVVHDGTVIYAKGFGMRNIADRAPVDPGTVFLLASVSKSLAATVVAASVGRGTVKWSDPVAKYIPGFTLRDPWVGSHVTIGDMFAHRSGLPDHAGDLLEELGYDRAAIVRKLALDPLQPFRITYQYTNFGLTAGAQAVADANHTSWAVLSKQLLYDPLGMTHTSSRWIDYERAPDHATLYVRAHKSWKPGFRDADAQSPAGGASATVLDLAKWMTLQMNEGAYGGKQLIPRDALFPMQQPQIVSSRPAQPTERPSFYGFGMGIGYDLTGRVRWSHSGAFSAGASTTYEMLPSEKLGIVVLTNAMPVGVPETIAQTFMDRVEFGHSTRDWYAFFSPLFKKLLTPAGELAGKSPPARPQPALPLSAYAGTYANRYYGPAKVAVMHGVLLLSIGPKPQRYTLRHWNGNVFALRIPEESGDFHSAVTFVPASDGHQAQMTIEYLNENGLGTFVR
jgi:CubicO group peptidase (beta-lactamase class C family)